MKKLINLFFDRITVPLLRRSSRFRPILIPNGILKSILMSLARMQPSTGRNMVIKRGEFGDEVYYGSC